MPPVARLEPFLLHENSMVRDSVGFHYFESWPRDEELALLVLEACRRYGEEACLNLLSFGCRFPLSARSLLEALRMLSESRPPFVEHWVSQAPLPLVKGRAELVRSVLSRRALTRLERRARFHQATATELWRRLDGLCRRFASRAFEPGEREEVEDLLEALAEIEIRESVKESVLALEESASHLRWALVELSGVMKLSELGECLVELLESHDDATPRVAAEALARIGSESIVSAIGARYPSGRRRFRTFALPVLKAVKLDSSGALLADLAEIESDPALRGRIFDALRFHFTARSESLLRRELERPSSWMMGEEIRKALLVFAEIRGAGTTTLEESEIYFHIPFDSTEE
jgi:hypothetical protein